MEGEEFHSSHITNCVLDAFSSCTAITFNIVTIHAIRKTSTLTKTLRTLLVSLAVSDLGVGLLAQPLHIAVLIMKFKETNDPACDATRNAFLISLNLFALASFFGVVVLSADRFLALHLHLRYQELVTHKRVITAVVSIWVFSVFLSILRLWIPKTIIFVIFATILFACLSALAFLNYKIFVAVRRHEHQIQTLRVQQIAQNIEMANDGRVRNYAVTAIYVYLVFLVCYLPNTCILMMTALKPNQPLFAVIQEYCRSLVFLNSSLNPLIYCWRMRDIRHNVIDILRNVAASHN